jgi:hypothetical protein
MQVHSDGFARLAKFNPGQSATNPDVNLERQPGRTPLSFYLGFVSPNWRIPDNGVLSSEIQRCPPKPNIATVTNRARTDANNSPITKKTQRYARQRCCRPDI